MKMWAQLFWGKQKGSERLGSDGVVVLDARYGINWQKSVCAEVAKRRGCKGFQIHRSTRFSVERPITEIVEVN